jgi:Kef-type K+ transport system membrane component KefB
MPTAWLDLPLMAAVVLASRLIAPRLPLAVPDTVVQLAGGLLLGPSALGWLRMNDVVMFLSALGMGYLLLTAGMDLELRVRNPGRRLSALGAEASTLLLALPLTLLLCAAAQIRDRTAVAAALLTTLMMPALKAIRANASLRGDLAGFTILTGAFGELAAAILVAVSAIGADVGLSVAVLALLLTTATTLLPLRRKDALRRPRAGRGGSAFGAATRALAVVAACAALAPLLGDEVVLAALAAGIWCSSRQPGRASWNALRARLDGIGLTLLAPMSFVAAGARVNTAAMGLDDRAWLAVPALVLAMGVCRTVPTLALARAAAGARAEFASGLLLSTKLTLVVVAVQVGQQSGSLTSASASTLVLAAMVTVGVFPTVADSLARVRPSARACQPARVEPSANRSPASDQAAARLCSEKTNAAFSTT